MLDCEHERVQAGWFLDESQRHRQGSPALNGGPPELAQPTASTSPGASAKLGSLPQAQGRASPGGFSLWEYVEEYHSRSPIFFNTAYMSTGPSVLRPNCSLACLSVWEYYLRDDLAFGPPFDFEVIEREEMREAEEQIVDGPLQPSLRRLVNACYDYVPRVMPDALFFLLQVGSKECTTF